MSQSSTRKRYSREFKLEVVKMVTSGGYSVLQIAEEFGISQKSLYDWKKKLEQQGILAFPGQGRLAPKDAEIRRLKRENEKLRQQREILKKAMGLVPEIERCSLLGLISIVRSLK